MSAVFVAFFVVVLSGVYYWSWISAGSRFLKLLFRLALLALAVILAYYGSFVLVFITSNIILRSAFAVLIVAGVLGLIIRKKLPQYSGKGLEGPYELHGIKYYVYKDKGNMVNAWYDGKRIIVSKSLLGILNEKELFAVLQHEVGHAKNRILSMFNSILKAVWVMIICSIIILVAASLLILSSPPLERVSAILILYSMGYMITAPTLAASWVGEHEADAMISEHSYLAHALAKMMLYEKLFKIQEGALNVEAKIVIDNITVKATSPMKVLYEFFKAVILSTPRDVIGFINKPLYVTHPPLWLRAWYVRST